MKVKQNISQMEVNIKFFKPGTVFQWLVSKLWFRFPYFHVGVEINGQEYHVVPSTGRMWITQPRLRELLRNEECEVLDLGTIEVDSKATELLDMFAYSYSCSKTPKFILEHIVYYATAGKTTPPMDCVDLSYKLLCILGVLPYAKKTYRDPKRFYRTLRQEAKRIYSE